MSFVHGGMAIAAAGLAGIPLVIHLLNRRRYREEPWAAMQFVLSAYQRTRRRLRVEQWVLLALRMLIMALVGLAVARPYVRSASAFSIIGERRVDRVVILDDSFSMRGLRADGQSAFDAAKGEIAKLLEYGGSGGALAIVSASRPARAWMEQPTRDRLAIRQMVDAAACGWGEADLGGAMALARLVLTRGDAAAEAREVYVVSDFASGAVAGGGGTIGSEFAGSAIDNVRVVAVDVSGGERPNASITALSALGPQAGAGQRVTLRAEASNFGPADLLDCQIVLRSGRRELGRRGIGVLRGGETLFADFDVQPEPGRTQLYTARLQGRLTDQAGGDDRLQEDDERDVALAGAGTRRVLAVEGRASAGRAEQELFFYRAALSALDSENDGADAFEVEVIAADELRRSVLKEYDVVVLGNVTGPGRGGSGVSGGGDTPAAGGLGEADGRRLSDYVEAGGGLIVFCGDQAGGSISAALVGLPGVELNGATRLETDEEAPLLRLADPSHPVVRDFVGQKRSILGQAHVTGWWRTTVSGDDAPAQSQAGGRKMLSIIETGGGEPILLAGQSGRGRVLLWLTSANMAWTNLPAKPDYLPLMANLTSFAAGDVNQGRNVLVGEVLTGRIGRATGRTLEIKRPDGRADVVHLLGGEAGRTWTYGQTTQPGVHEAGGAAAGESFAVNANGTESDLRRADEPSIARLLGSSPTILSRLEAAQFGAAGTVRELGWLLALVLLLAISVESVLGRAFGGAR